ncbi:uncharacterized protein [Asterias amurensis]|uniref:uncharacterized protein n=1 Tax=Asterias amurensis TaxID=7602 RepID=UPI003AB20DCC
MEQVDRGTLEGFRPHQETGNISESDAQQVACQRADCTPATSSATSTNGGGSFAGETAQSKTTTPTRWSSRRAGSRSNKAVDRDDFKKQKKMRIDKFDDFLEWIDGDAALRYHPKDADARKHLSGWAMRNTNNHNKKVLKKSCLGVFVCSRSCRSPSGDIITVRPATSDRARRKQADKKCPRPGCDGKLYHVACTGKNGYPVTHFWRVTDAVVVFQSKGHHDHPRPDVVKTPSVAKMALFEYHKNHKHERPKDICKRMGVHIHKSFSRVDRVARQLREVQSVLSKDDKEFQGHEVKVQHGYSLRSPLTRLWSTHHSKVGGHVENHQARPGLTIPPGGIRHHSLNNGYPDQPQYEQHWTPSGSYIPPQNALQGDYQHGYMTGFTAQLPTGTADYYHNGMYAGYQLSSTGDLVYDPSINLEGYNTAPKTETVFEGSKMTELTVMNEPGRETSESLNSPLKHLPLKANPMMHQVEEVGGHLDNYQLAQTRPLKRSLPPALHHIDAKQPKHEQPNGMESHHTKQTSSINIDMSSFSDIFDISASLGEEGLAGRPKTPVFHPASPPANESPQKPAGAALISEAPASSPSNLKGEITAGSPQSTLSVSVVSSPSTVHDTTDQDASTTSPGHKYRQMIHHSPNGPVLTQLSTHSHPNPTNPPEDENGTYIDLLVSMYLNTDPKDSEKPISTLKNEFHVYTERNNQKGMAYRTEQGLHFAAHHPEHFKSPTSSQFDFSWYDMDRRSQHYRNMSTSQGSLLSPLNIAGHFDYPAPYIKDAFCTEPSTEASRVSFMRHSPGSTINRHVY